MMMLWLALVFGCAKTANKVLNFKLQTIETTELVELSKHADSDVRGDAYVALIDGSSEHQRAEWAAQAIADESISVRSKAVERLLEHRELALLKRLSAKYSDADLLLCTVALRRFWIDGSHNSIEWPLISKQDAEARMICALAAAEVQRDWRRQQVRELGTGPADTAASSTVQRAARSGSAPVLIREDELLVELLC